MSSRWNARLTREHSSFNPIARAGGISIAWKRTARVSSASPSTRRPIGTPRGLRMASSSRSRPSAAARGDIYLIDADGGNLRQVTDHPAYEGAPRFTPDGGAIVFEGERDGRAEIYEVALDSGRVRRITSSITRKLGPSYSPDGSELAFMEKTLIRWQVSVRDIKASGSKRRVTSGGGACRPAWSPDGALIAYVSTLETDNADIWFRQMSGSREGSAWRVPTRPNAHNYDPSFLLRRIVACDGLDHHARGP